MALSFLDTGGSGAHARIRTGDLFLTKEMLCHLSYVGNAPTPDSICCILGARIVATIDDVLERTRSRLKRLEPEEAARDVERGALLVDTRTETQRSTQGEIPGALVIDRTVLEWRLDPPSPHRIAQPGDD